MEKIKSQIKKFSELDQTKKYLLATALGLIFLTGLSVWLYGQFFLSTDDAYLNANITQIAPRVTGQVQQLNIVNNQYVKKGDILFTLNPEPFQIAIAQAEAQVAMSQADLADAQITATRVLTMVQKKYQSPQDGDTAIAHLNKAKAALSLAQANLDQARLNLSYTQISAPDSGWVANLSLRNGTVVSENQPIFALISDHEFWADANFKETSLEKIKPGQGATIRIDMYPHHPFKGVVESISGGSGTAFSLLPPENATGNWVKVTQRVPVRIHILNPDPHYPLRIGTSSTVTVKLHSTA